MSESIKLKPCPFCGNQHVYATTNDMCVPCVMCPCGTSFEAETTELAIEGWNQRANDQWIRVEERFPSEGMDVLCVWPGCKVASTAEFWNGKFHLEDYGPIDDVTHWQPLPEPPK